MLILRYVINAAHFEICACVSNKMLVQTAGGEVQGIKLQ